MKTENTPSQSSIADGETIELSTRFGSCSRGKCWGKFFPGKTRATGDFEWCEKSGGTLYLAGPGHYVVGSSDGFSREAKAEFSLKTKVSYSDMTPAEKIARQREQIAASEGKDPDAVIVITGPGVGKYAAGDKVTRAELISERKRLIAELEGSTTAKTKEQENLADTESRNTRMMEM